MRNSMILALTSCQTFRWLELHQYTLASVKSLEVLPLTSVKLGFHLSHYLCIMEKKKKKRIETNMLSLPLCFFKQLFLGCTIKSC